MICSELTPNNNELALKSSYQLVADFYTTPAARHNIMKHTAKSPDGTGNRPPCKQERNSVHMLPGRGAGCGGLNWFVQALLHLVRGQ